MSGCPNRWCQNVINSIYHHKPKYQYLPFVEKPHLFVYCHFLIYAVKIYSLCLKFLNGFGLALLRFMGFPGGSAGRESAAMWETRSLGREDPLEKGMATHFSILACRIPCVAHGVAKSRT